MTIAARAVVAIGLAVAMSACGDDGNDRAGTGPNVTTTTVPSTGVVVDVLAIDNIFRNEITTAAVGDEVVWSNLGRNEHNIVPVGGGDWGVGTMDFQPGDTYSYSFGTPGAYDYYCSIHGTEDVGMIGTVVVG